MPLFSKKSQKIRRSHYSRNLLEESEFLKFDFSNKVRYGPDPPLFFKILWVDPREIDTVIGKEEAFNATVFTYPLLNRSTMNRVKLDQIFDIQTGEFTFRTGFSGYYHRGEYREESFDRQNFYTRTLSIGADLFVQSELNPIDFQIYLPDSVPITFLQVDTYVSLQELKQNFSRTKSFPSARDSAEIINSSIG